MNLTRNFDESSVLEKIPSLCHFRICGHCICGEEGRMVNTEPVGVGC